MSFRCAFCGEGTAENYGSLPREQCESHPTGRPLGIHNWIGGV